MPDESWVDVGGADELKHQPVQIIRVEILDETRIWLLSQLSTLA